MELDKTESVFVAGHNGMVGSAIVRELQESGFTNLITKGRNDLDLRDQREVEKFFQQSNPEIVIMAAGKVGGILANHENPFEFIYDNATMGFNVIKAALQYKVSKLLYLGSSCIYPRSAAVPIKEEQLLDGALEPTNRSYAVSKIACITLCEAIRSQFGRCFFSVLPCNLYGPGDNYNPDESHVIPGLIRRLHDAKETKQPSVKVWGTGEVYREFLHVEDLARACVYLLSISDPPLRLNVGSGEEYKISALASLVAKTVGYPGELENDPGKPDGVKTKLIDSTRIRSLGWKPLIDLESGLQSTYEDFLTGY